MNPKVFVSHASEDKERFVVPFATALRSRGVEAWVDKWEMLPGDSLVDKIFEEGLKGASAVIIVLSKISVTKPWVREELNAAVVKRIEGGAKLIPIVLDGCDVPAALRTTVWQGVQDPTNFAECLDRVTDSIFGHSRKPPIGEPAPYLAGSAPRVNGLTAADSLLLLALFDDFLKPEARWMDSKALSDIMIGKGVAAAAAAESLHVLEHMGYAESMKTIGAGDGLRPSRISGSGVSAILGKRESGLVQSVGFAILNDGLRRSDAIAVALGQPQPLADHAIGLLADAGHLIMSREISPVRSIAMVNPSLRRALDAQEQ